MATEDAGIYARESDYLDRSVQIGVASGRILSVSFPTTPDAEAGDDHPVLDRIDRYLDGVEEVSFTDLTVALTMATDQREVLQAVRGIPYGQQVTVGKLASMTPGLDDEGDEGTVRTALAENPAPLVVPDHRVRDGPSAAPPEVEQLLRSLEGL